VPAVRTLRDLGKSLVLSRDPDATSARDRILHYFLTYPHLSIAGEELAIVAGIKQYARRVRELRVEFGWQIASGKTVADMLDEADLSSSDLPPGADGMGADDYVLLSTEQDREAAHRWNVANEIRKRSVSIRDRLLEFFRRNVGQSISGEELKYVARGAQSWPRRVRELRTEEGWPVKTDKTGRPDLPVGTYLLEENRQSPEHDRHIPDPARVEVLERDGYRCRNCKWSYDDEHPGDPRSLLELHHVEHHATGGSNEPENLIALCNVCHDEVHRLGLSSPEAFFAWLREGADLQT
jgi:hypothetical protein